MQDGPLVINDNVIATLLTDSRYVNEFPFIKQAAEAMIAAATTCQRCQQRMQAERARIVQTLKQSLASVSGEQLLKLKTLLGFRQLRVVIDYGGQPTAITF